VPNGAWLGLLRGACCTLLRGSCRALHGTWIALRRRACCSRRRISAPGTRAGGGRFEVRLRSRAWELFGWLSCRIWLEPGFLLVKTWQLDERAIIEEKFSGFLGEAEGGKIGEGTFPLRRILIDKAVSLWRRTLKLEIKRTVGN